MRVFQLLLLLSLIPVTPAWAESRIEIEPKFRFGLPDFEETKFKLEDRPVRLVIRLRYF